MQRQDWAGVFPAITAPFREDGTVDYEFLARHVGWLLDHGCTGLVPLGSLGEAATLTFDEKVRVLEVCREATAGRVPLVAGTSGLSTMAAVELARAAHRGGCDGLMVLPPYSHKGAWREIEAHFSAIITATPLSCMIYNNPIAYSTDLLPEQIQALARHANVHAVKESSGDLRRMTALRALVGDDLALFVGIDDLIVEGIAVGATGWIAGLVNACPAESVRLFELARAGKHEETRRLYEWFLPLLRLDVGPKFVQLIKLVQAEVGMGSERVRGPRLPVTGPEREAALAVIRAQLSVPARGDR
jgi:4-hydroxy-tetrahydrodipicolinate synthase